MVSVARHPHCGQVIVDSKITIIIDASPFKLPINTA